MVLRCVQSYLFDQRVSFIELTQSVQERMHNETPYMYSDEPLEDECVARRIPKIPQLVRPQPGCGGVQEGIQSCGRISLRANR